MFETGMCWNREVEGCASIRERSGGTGRIRRPNSVLEEATKQPQPYKPGREDIAGPLKGGEEEPKLSYSLPFLQ